MKESLYGVCVQANCTGMYTVPINLHKDHAITVLVLNIIDIGEAHSDFHKYLATVTDVLLIRLVRCIDHAHLLSALHY